MAARPPRILGVLPSEVNRFGRLPSGAAREIGAIGAIAERGSRHSLAECGAQAGAVHTNGIQRKAKLFEQVSTRVL